MVKEKEFGSLLGLGHLLHHHPVYMALYINSTPLGTTMDRDKHPVVNMGDTRGEKMAGTTPSSARQVGKKNL